MTRRILTLTVVLSTVLAMALTSSLEGQEAPEISGSLSSFEVRNTDRRAYTDLEMQISGEIEPDCIRALPGWGAPPLIREGTSVGRGVTIRWRNRRDPIEPGRSERFGLDLKCGDRLEARAFWSIGGRPAAEIPVPWQTWQARPGVIWDVIQLPGDVDIEPVAVQRELVTLKRAVSPEALTWNDVERLVARTGLEWQRFDREPVKVPPGEQLTLRIPVSSEDQAVIVRYTVQHEGRVISRFVNQAILVWPGPVCHPGLPAPQVQITGTEDFIGGDGNPYTRYRFSVTNRAAYPDALFAPAPDLPPCGLNANASRTWVDIEDGDGNRIYGFCALSSAENLDSLWFARPRGESPPECVSVTLRDRRCELEYTSECAPTEGHGPTCINFEDPALGSTYNVGDTFMDSGATMTVQPFQWSNGNWHAGGQASIGNAGQAGASGQEVAVNNVNLGFAFPALPDTVMLNFGEFGGNLNLEVNGVFQNFEDFADVNGAVVGGTQVTVTNGFGNDQGTLKLVGEVHSLAVGGQELFLDRVCITEQPGVDAEGAWIMPYAVGGTRIDRIKASGLLDYNTGSLSIVDAPFGGRMGFRVGRANVIPTAGITHYRFQYKHESEADWHDFDENVSVHYVKEAPATPPSFPVLSLGPTDFGGKNLYRFRPHEADLPSLVPTLAPGEMVSWPSHGFLGDIYSGFLNTVAKSLSPGRHLIRLEIYDSTGTQVMPGAGTFRFVVPTGTAPDGTILTDFASPASIDAGAFVFSLHVDNRPTAGAIDEPEIDGTGAGDCGFLRYDPSLPTDPMLPGFLPVDVAFHATHPDDRALFRFRIVRGPHTLPATSIHGVEVSALAAGGYTGDGNGNFSRAFSTDELLHPGPPLVDCEEGAFSELLYVWAKATNGWHRLSGLDASAVRAFALTPLMP